MQNEKNFTYNLDPDITGNYAVMPVLHDYFIDKIKIENNSLFITSVDFEKHDYDYIDFAGFHPKKVVIEFIFENDIECNIEVSKYSAKKQLKIDNINGYGKRTNCYDINDFIDIYKNYKIEILNNLVGYNEVRLILAGHNNKEHCTIEMTVLCKQIKYTFTN